MNNWTELSIVGTFKNGKERRIRVRNSEGLLTLDDVNYLVECAKQGRTSFNDCLKKDRFVDLTLYMNRREGSDFYCKRIITTTQPYDLDIKVVEHLCKLTNQFK